MGAFNVNYQAGGRMDFPFMPTKQFPYFKGVRLEMGSTDVIAESSYIVKEDAELISIAIAASVYKDRDYWNFYVNDTLIMDEIYTKELPEGLYLMVVVPLKKGDRLKLVFHNKSLSSKSVWFNYQMLV